MILVPICILYNFQMTIASAGHQKGCNSIKSKAIVPRGGGVDSEKTSQTMAAHLLPATSAPFPAKTPIL
jgi:hypothetical protein